METKPGYRTTEFWLALVLPQLVALLALFGVFTPEQSDAVVGSVSQIVGAVISGASAFGYSVARGKAKEGIKPGDTK